MERAKKIILIAIMLFVATFSLIVIDKNEIVFEWDNNIQFHYEYQSDFIIPKVEAYYQKKHFKFIKKKLEVEIIGQVDTSILGSYLITFKAKKENLEKDLNLTFLVVDNTSPVITLVDDENYFTEYGSEYIEQGYSCLDNYDGDITDKVIREVKDDRIIYSVTDSSGNKTSITRNIRFIDTTPPVITFQYQSSVVEVGKEYICDFTAYDLKDGDLTSEVEILGRVDTSKVGVYTLTYLVSDKAGNFAEVKKKVYVYKKQSDPHNLHPTVKIVYLTFDDGPSSYTQRLLEILDKYNVKATFFVNGINSYYFDLVGEAYRRGHTIGNHTYSHNYSKIYSSVNAFYSDLDYNADLIYQQTGMYPMLVRFPGGSSNTVSINYCYGIMTKLAKSLTKKGYKYFDWNVSSGDTGTYNTNSIYENVINGISRYNISIVLQHDTNGNSVAAVEKIILWGLSNGYTFLPLDLSSPTCHHGLNN